MATKQDITIAYELLCRFDHQKAAMKFLRKLRADVDMTFVQMYWDNLTPDAMAALPFQSAKLAYAAGASQAAKAMLNLWNHKKEADWRNVALWEPMRKIGFLQTCDRLNQ